MKEYKLFTDSTVDLPYDICDKMDIQVIPMEFVMEDHVYTHYADARELSFSDFYKKIREGKRSNTTQINYLTYKETFRAALKEGMDVLYLALSSGLSGTYQGAVNVAKELMEEFPDRKVVCIDTLSAAIGEGVLVYHTAEKMQEGMTFDELCQWVNDNRLNACHWFVVDDLQHLKQGGRITAFQANMGTLLNLKPVLSMDHEGKLVTVSKARGSKKAMTEFINRLVSEGVDNEKHTVVIGHADNLTDANKLAEKIRDLDIVKDIIISDIGPVIGTHVGAGMFALAFMGKRSV